MIYRRPGATTPVRYTVRGRRAGWVLFALGWMTALALGGWFAVTLAWVAT